MNTDPLFSLRQHLYAEWEVLKKQVDLAAQTLADLQRRLESTKQQLKNLKYLEEQKQEA